MVVILTIVIILIVVFAIAVVVSNYSKIVDSIYNETQGRFIQDQQSGGGWTGSGLRGKT